MSVHDKTWTYMEIENAVYRACRCGGRGPNDNPCDACIVYHLLMHIKDPKRPMPKIKKEDE